MTPVLLGAVAMASFVAALFFFRFWRQTKDRFFLFFSSAFAMDCLTRLLMAFTNPTGEQEPLFYVGRLAMFALIVLAIVDKNRSQSRS